jgi:hypothetical protein
MREWRALTADELARAEERLRHPRPGSRIEAAQEFGIDLTLLIEKLRLSPAERVREMHDAMVAAERVRGASRRGARGRMQIECVAHVILASANAYAPRSSHLHLVFHRPVIDDLRRADLGREHP